MTVLILRPRPFNIQLYTTNFNVVAVLAFKTDSILRPHYVGTVDGLIIAL